MERPSADSSCSVFMNSPGCQQHDTTLSPVSSRSIAPNTAGMARAVLVLKNAVICRIHGASRSSVASDCGPSLEDHDDGQ